MIILKTLKWSNAFSYGNSNSINLADHSLLQLIGKNGHGKSSIPLILEEVIYNANSKRIKKSDILNRYVKDKTYTIELNFEKDGEQYTIKTARGSTQTVKLYHNGVDISAHTATATYKMIESIIGLDHKTFSQIVYQSSVASLEFLTATDTARKKFLIDLLNLGTYTKASEVFKEVSNGLSKEVDKLSAQKETVNTWLSRNPVETLIELPIEIVPVIDQVIKNRIIELKSEIANIASINKSRSNNNLYKAQLAAITLHSRVWPENISQDRLLNLEIKRAELEKADNDSKIFQSKFTGLTGVCPTCIQPINSEVLVNLVVESKAKQVAVNQEWVTICNEIAILKKQLNDKKNAELNNREWEKYHSLYDPKLDSNLLVEDTLTAELSKLLKLDNEQMTTIEKVTIANTKAAAHNAKIAVLLEQKQSMQAELEIINKELAEKVDRLSTLQILVKTFSTTGLVAYKIECLVKDLENLTNTYLTELYDGRFQLSFEISTSDKLNVVINDNGADIDILALSSGERARVNVATLLAIRKLMQALSNSRINLLVLDETIETLDSEGKERLIELLLKEENLNTVLVSHGFQHPLVEKIHVIKENNISRIE